VKDLWKPMLVAAAIGTIWYCVYILLFK